MEEYIESIEKFLRGQMSQEEDNVFKKSLNTDAHMRTCAFIMAFIIKNAKNRVKICQFQLLLLPSHHGRNTFIFWRAIEP